MGSDSDSYYLTRKSPGKERLIYTIDQPAVFETGTNNFTMQNIDIANVGDSAAKDVQIFAELVSGVSSSRESRWN